MGLPISERIGWHGFMFPFVNPQFTDGDYFYKFLCYQDNSFGAKQFTSWPCNYTDKVGLRDIYGQNAEIHLYPNPTSGMLNIDLQSANSRHQIRLVNLLGEEVLMEAGGPEQEIQLDLRPLQNGIYFLQVLNQGKLIATEKIIKE